ncbi:hypothetical protein C4E24_09235 [ANME-1 cluster archaeon AG-394-G21]|nr:hypothetical protein [ANME-1 cluster archaeon AG-394-G21]
MARNTGYWYHRFPWSRDNRFLAIIFDFAAWEDLETPLWHGNKDKPIYLNKWSWQNYRHTTTFWHFILKFYIHI